MRASNIGIAIVFLLVGCSSTNTPGQARMADAHGIADPPPVLCGTVTDDAGDPIFGATVRVYTGHKSYFPFATIQTDQKGRYWIRISHGAGSMDESGHRKSFPAGIRLEHPNRLGNGTGLDWTGEVPNVPDREERRDFTIKLEGYENTKPDKNRIVDPPPILHGTVRDERGEPIPWVTVRAFTGGPSYFPFATVQTDLNGRYWVRISPRPGGYDPKGPRCYFNVGITLSHPKRVNSGGGLDWRGMVTGIPDNEERRDFAIQLDRGEPEESGPDQAETWIRGGEPSSHDHSN